MNDANYSFINSLSLYSPYLGTVGCIRCKDLEPHYQKVFDHYRSNPSIGVYKMTDINLVRKLGLQKVPSVMLFRHGVPILYEGK